LKLDELLKDLITMKVFGKVAGYALTTEYQKCSSGNLNAGLAHAAVGLSERRMDVGF
jgi:hypothetical protein